MPTVATGHPGIRAVRRAGALVARSLPVLALLASPLTLAAQEGEHAEGGAAGQLFSVDLGLSLWTVVIFLGLLWVLWRFAWGPILDAVNEREARIQGALDEADRRQEEARKLLEEHRAQLSDARRQAQEIIQEGRDAGQKVRQEIEAKARDESQAILERARREIEREKDSALDAIRAESVDLALAAASRLLSEKMDQEQDRRLVARYLEDLSDGREGAEA